MDDKQVKLTLTLVLLVAPLVFLAVIGYFSLSATKTFDAILESGTTVTGTVDSVVRSGFEHPGTETLTVSYTVDGKDCTTFVLAETGSLQVGDTLELLYDQNDPVQASTEESYAHIMKTYKVELIILAIVFPILLVRPHDTAGHHGEAGHPGIPPQQRLYDLPQPQQARPQPAVRTPRPPPYENGSGARTRRSPSFSADQRARIIACGRSRIA